MLNLRNFLFISTALFVVGFPLSGNARTPDEDFAERCRAPGVIKCVGFDNADTDFTRGKLLAPDGLGVYRAGQDTEVKASGTGSLVFALPPPPHAGANIAGSWAGFGSPIFGRTFSENSTFYFQFRIRLSPEMLNNTWPKNNAWKTVAMYYNTVPCTGIAFASHNHYMSGFPTSYTNCGAFALITDPATGKWKRQIAPPYLLQQGDYNCAYGNFNEKDCFYFKPNEWLTFYHRVSIGTWGQPSSLFQIWVQREGETGYKQIANVPEMVINCNNAPCDQSPNKDAGFNNLMFTPYMTGLDKNAGLPEVTSKVWYDELIISTEPIAAPTLSGTVAATPPPSPIDLLLQ